MWPFKKRVAGTEGSDSPNQPFGRGPSGEWANLPAIERTVTPMPATIETATFQADLAAQRPPEQFLKPLSHGLSPSGPSGLIGGLVMPALRTERAGVPVQRSAVKFAPRPAGRWERSAPDAMDQPEVPEEVQLAGAGPATAYPAPEPPVQADLLESPAPEAPRPAAKPAGSGPVLMRVRSDALPMVRLPSTPQPASPTNSQPAPVSAAPTRSPSPEPPAADEGSLNTLGSEPQELQGALPPEAVTPAPHPLPGEATRRAAPIEAPVQRTATPVQSPSPETGGRPDLLPLPPNRPGRPLGLGPPLRSYDNAEPAVASPPTQASPQEVFEEVSCELEPALPEKGFRVPTDPALGTHTEAPALPIQLSASPTPSGRSGGEPHGPARFESPGAPTGTQAGHSVERDRPRPVQDPIAYDESAAVEVQRSAFPEPELPLLGQPAAEAGVSALEAPARQTPTEAPVKVAETAQPTRLDPDRRPSAESPVQRSEATRPALMNHERSLIAELPAPIAEEGLSPLTRAPKPALPGTPEPEPVARMEFPALQIDKFDPAPLTPSPKVQRLDAGPTETPPPVNEAPGTERPTLGGGDPEQTLSTWKPADPTVADAPSGEAVPFSDLRAPESSGLPVQRLDAATPAPEALPAAEPVELPLLGREKETSLVEPTPEPHPAATAQAPVSGIPGPLALQGDFPSETELPGNRPPLGEIHEAPATRPLLGEPVAPELNPPQLHLPRTAESPSPESPVVRHEVPIQRSSLIERARSWAARGTQPDSMSAPRDAEAPVASRRVERPSSGTSFELPASKQTHPADHTWDLPAFRPPSVQRDPDTPETSVQPHHPTLTGDATPTLQLMPDSPVPASNTQDLLPTPGAPEWLPTVPPEAYSENPLLVGQDQALTVIRTEPEHPAGAPVQRSATAAPERLGPFDPLTNPPVAPGRPAAGPQDHTMAFVPAGISDLQVTPLGGPAAEFQPPTAQVPLVGAALPTGLGLPASFPAPANRAAKPLVQRSSTSPVWSADPRAAAALYPSERRTAPTRDGSPEPYSHRPLTVGPNALAPMDTSAQPYSAGPLTISRSVFAAPYRPDAVPTPADRNGTPNVKSAPDLQTSRDLFVAPAEDAAAVAIAAGVASRSSDGALVFRSPEAAAPPAQPAPTPAPTPQPAPVPLQRTTVSAPPPAPNDDPEPPDLDELAMRLYPKLRPYLRKDLWLDRERSGLLADLR